MSDRPLLSWCYYFRRCNAAAEAGLTIVQLPLLSQPLLQCYPHWALTCGRCCFSYHHSCCNNFGAVADVPLPPLLQCYAPLPSMLLLWLLLIPLMCYRCLCCNAIPPPPLTLMACCWYHCATATSAAILYRRHTWCCWHATAGCYRWRCCYEVLPLIIPLLLW